MKRKLRIGILSMTVIMLSACGAKNETAADDFADTEETEIPEENAPTDWHDLDIEDWQATYLSFLDDFESAEKYADRYSYGLIYVDEDEIPELSIRRMDEAGGCFILTYHDGVLSRAETGGSDRTEYNMMKTVNLYLDISGMGKTRM